MTRPNTLTATLTAAAVDTAGRTIAGMVLPYGTPGSTSIGLVSVRAGAIELPEDLTRVKLFLDHDRTNPVGWAVEAASSDAGLTMTFKVGTGEAGDLALEQASPDNPLRDGLSVEVDGIEFDDEDAEIPEILAGFLRAVALVPIPAFDDARVASVAAARAAARSVSLHPNQGDTMTETPTATSPAPAASAAPDASTLAAAALTQPSPAAALPSVTPATAPATTLGATAGRPADAISTPREFYAALVGRHTRSLSPELEAALSDITQGATSETTAPQFVGELWSGVRYQRRVVPLLGSGVLSSYEVNGWRWVVKPAVAAYAGDKAAVPSNAATTEAVSESAERLAGAHDIDRKYRDFNDTAFFESYYGAMTESYALLSDAAAADAVEAAATAVDNAYEADGFLGAIATGIAAIDTATNAESTFVLANTADLIPFVLGTTNLDLPAYLDLLGIDPRRIVAHPAITAGHVIVGTRDAATFYELPGSPIRVEAVDMVKGGIDAGVFGYYALLTHDADALQNVTITPAP